MLVINFQYSLPLIFSLLMLLEIMVFMFMGCIFISNGMVEYKTYHTFRNRLLILNIIYTVYVIIIGILFKISTDDYYDIGYILFIMGIYIIYIIVRHIAYCYTNNKNDKR